MRNALQQLHPGELMFVPVSHSFEFSFQSRHIPSLSQEYLGAGFDARFFGKAVSGSYECFLIRSNVFKEFPQFLWHLTQERGEQMNGSHRRFCGRFGTTEKLSGLDAAAQSAFG